MAFKAFLSLLSLLVGEINSFNKKPQHKLLIYFFSSPHDDGGGDDEQESYFKIINDIIAATLMNSTILCEIE
jgi:hypothetical protein